MATENSKGGLADDGVSHRLFLVADASGAAAAAFAGGGSAEAAAATPEAETAMAAIGLRTESAHNPLGIDVKRPRLGWRLSSAERGEKQSAYRILVTREPRLLAAVKGDVWDSGKVVSDESRGVTYGGPALSSSTRYHWKVRVWDKAGKPSDWSAPAWWETALLRQSDWNASWIGRQEAPLPDLIGSQWIWYPEGDPGATAPPGTRYFRRNVTIPDGKTVETARMLLTVDDQFTAYLNSVEVTKSTGTWQEAVTVDLSGQLQVGNNTLTLAATNAAPSPAGAIAVLEIKFTDDTELTIRTNDQWKAFNAEVPAWTESSFDDNAWPASLEVTAYGGPPWALNVVNPPAPAPLLRREFTPDKPVRRARVYMAGLGYGELQLNGRAVGDHVLDPATSDYEERVLYVTHDVTDLLQRGRNVLGAELGRGFFGLRTSTAWAWTQAPWNRDPCLLAQLEIEYADGTRDVVATNSEWRTAAGPTRSDSMYGGETYDARVEQPNWALPGFVDDGWSPAVQVTPPGGRLVAQSVQPIRILETIDPVAVTQPKPGAYLFDLGRTLGGWAALRVSGPSGAKVSLEYGQQLHADGTVNLAQGYVDGGRFQRDEYILRGGGQESWHPRFSHKSFRYVQVTGLPGPPGADTLRGQEVRTAALAAGAFSSSSQLYNRIHGMVVRSTGHHLLGIPAVDVMYEKMGWTADAHLNVSQIAHNFDSHRFLAKWLDDIGDNQAQDGQITLIVPSGGWGTDHAPEWTAAYPIVMWELYWQFGDLRALERHYDGVRRYVDWELARLDGAGLATTVLGDWLSPGGYTQPLEDTRLTASAYLYRSLRILADSANVVGRDGDAERYEQQALALRERFNAAFLDLDGGVYRTASDPGYRQTSNAIPLAFDLVPQPLRGRVAAGLVADVHARDDHLNTGALGTAVLLPVLTETGYVDVAHAIASQRTSPSWGSWLEHGADTLWETWEVQHGGQGRPPSHDHYLFGSIDEWFYEHLAGIKAGRPGYKEIVIRPHPGGDLAGVKGKYDSEYGEIVTDWEADGSAFKLEVTIPVNTTAIVHVPTGSPPSSVTESGLPAYEAEGVKFLRVDDGYAVFAVGSGKYRFLSEADWVS